MFKCIFIPFFKSCTNELYLDLYSYHLLCYTNILLQPHNTCLGSSYTARGTDVRSTHVDRFWNSLYPRSLAHTLQRIFFISNCNTWLVLKGLQTKGNYMHNPNWLNMCLLKNLLIDVTYITWCNMDKSLAFAIFTKHLLNLLHL